MIYSKVPIRKGFSVWSDETARCEALNKLKDLGIVELKESTWQPCSNESCSNSILVDSLFQSEGWTKCASCGNGVRLTQNLRSRYEIGKVNFGSVLRFFKKNISNSFSHNNLKFDKSLNAWTVVYNRKIVPIFVSQISSYNKFIDYDFDSAWICILLNWDIESIAITYYDKSHFVDFWDIMNGEVDLSQCVRDISTSFKPNPSLAIESRFTSFLRSVEPGEFERDFVDTFLNEVRINENKLGEFLRFLSRRKDTIFNSKVVFAGGAANPDFYSFNLMEYLQDGFKPSKVGEAKRYNLTEFDYDDFSKQFAHADAADTLSIVSTNRISPSVWRFVWDHSEAGSLFHHVIFDRDIIIMLMNVLGITNECLKT